MPHTYEFPRPQVAVDCVVFAVAEGRLHVLLVQRDSAPFEGFWALPGRIVRLEESLEDAAREALSKAGVGAVFLEQLYTFGAPDRDPSGRIVSVAHYALVDLDGLGLVAGEGTRAVRWTATDHLPSLAYDHARILEVATARLRAKIRYRPIGFELLPDLFTLPQLQGLYETILGTSLDRRNFRRRILSTGLLERRGQDRSGPGRPADLYRFDARRYEALARDGFDFRL